MIVSDNIGDLVPPVAVFLPMTWDVRSVSRNVRSPTRNGGSVTRNEDFLAVQRNKSRLLGKLAWARKNPDSTCFITGRERTENRVE